MKLNIAVIFGSRTCEHEVAIISAVQLMRHVNREKYDVIPIVCHIDEKTDYTVYYLSDYTEELARENHITKT